jgi:hypothetical protein
MPGLQGEARKGIFATDNELLCCANVHSATRFGRNVPHVVFETYNATTSYEQDQLPTTHLLKHPHLTLIEMKHHR